MAKVLTQPATRQRRQAVDADGSPRTYFIVNNPLHGTVQITNYETGAYSDTPSASYVCTDHFTFTARDGYHD